MSQPSNLFESPKQERFFLFALAGIQFTHILDFMIMMPLGPQFIKALSINTHQFGLLLSSYTFAAAIAGVFATYYVDRFERRQLLLRLYVCFIVATVACGFAPNYHSLFIARACAGAFGGILGSLVQTIVADSIPFERRGKALGTVMAAFSVSTVAGVPLSLFLANHVELLGWRAPFIFIGLISTLILYIGYRNIPKISGHLHHVQEGSRLKQIYDILIAHHHLRAFLFMGLIMLTGFSVIPYIALYLTSNVGVADSYISLIYLCGGVATLMSSRLIGHMADKYGKVKVFRVLAIVSLIPLIVTTNLVPVPLWVVLINSTSFFILISGRMIPAMAIVSQLVEPKIRGTFMSLVGSIQMLASGIASVLAGLVVTISTDGKMEHYNLVGYGAVACSLLTFWLVGYIHSDAKTKGT
ncbi:MFS transporter [Polynucleobacter wuianus]|uniref:MFS transporter n=1 Tax=Polynucleobacter wuianus TaxID=1743168 RepID=A0A191UE91_9BURK|nr:MULTISPECIES: MFS transporter [Polynucleobacter]ANI99329.1 MFS transporter [Polynucleobacter wuianus]MBU3552070.1 MFS transporter [Polynucleobacter sp. MWH-Post4-6-1]